MSAQDYNVTAAGFTPASCLMPFLRISVRCNQPDLRVNRLVPFRQLPSAGYLIQPRSSEFTGLLKDPGNKLIHYGASCDVSITIESLYHRDPDQLTYGLIWLNQLLCPQHQQIRAISHDGTKCRFRQQFGSKWIDFCLAVYRLSDSRRETGHSRSRRNMSKLALAILDPDGARRRDIARRLSHLGTIRTLHNDGNAEGVVRPGEVLLVHESADCLAELCKAAKSGELPVSVIGYAENPNIANVVAAMRAGATGYLKWPFQEREFIAQLGEWQHESFADESIDIDHEDVRHLATLTCRENEVLHFMSSGKANKEIALQMGISPRTVESHRANMLMKLGVANSVEAIRLALVAGTSVAGKRKDVR